MSAICIVTYAGMATPLKLFIHNKIRVLNIQKKHKSELKNGEI